VPFICTVIMSAFSDDERKADAAVKGAHAAPEIDSERAINEEYKVWKKNTPFMYDTVMTHSLDWPSLTVQWLPDVVKPVGKDIAIHKMLLGTHAYSDEEGTTAEPNYLIVAEVALPLPTVEIDARQYDDERGELGGFGGVQDKIVMKIKMVHEGEVHRARAMPQNPSMIATKSPSDTVFVFDYSKHPSSPVDATCRPQHRCHGHTSDGWGLAWNPHEQGQLLSGSDDALICLWDLREAGHDVDPMQVRRGHTANVEDVDWHKSDTHMFGSVGDDSMLMLWDVRDSAAKPIHSITAHDGDANCLSFNPFNEYLLATGGSDTVVKVWDIRSLNEPICNFEWHMEGVYQVSWAPFNGSILASSSRDRRVHIWDMSRIGDKQDEADAEDGPPELLFIHGGHTANVSEFSWSPTDDWVIASVAEDNILQIWQMVGALHCIALPLIFLNVAALLRTGN
jgi:WD40 repeat protein